MKKTAKQSQKARLADYANLLYIRARLSWVTLMERGSGRLGIKGQRIAWIVFGILGISACLLSILGIPGKLTEGTGLRPVRITKVRTAVGYQEKPALNDRDLKSELHAIRQYLDSLRESTSGRATLDSIITSRPGLLDSLAMAEKIINNHKN